MVRDIVDVSELSSRLTELLVRIAQGHEVTVVMDEKPVARLLPPDRVEMKRVPGLHLGEIWSSEDFDDPLTDEFWNGEE